MLKENPNRWSSKIESFNWEMIYVKRKWFFNIELFNWEMFWLIVTK